MNVWVIGRNYPLPQNNMQGSFELEQAKMLGRYGNQVSYLACSLHPRKVIKERGCCAWTEDGVQVHTYSAIFLPRVYPLFLNGLRTKCWAQLLRTVEAQSGLPDVIHVHYPAMLMLAGALRPYHERGVRIVATEHWAKVLKKQLDPAELKQYRAFSQVCDGMVCVGRPLAQSVQELIGLRPVVIPNVVNAAFAPATHRGDGFTFVCVGRLIRDKQVDAVIRQFAACFKGQTDVRLIVIGGGAEAENLRKLVGEAGVQSQVEMTGTLDRRETAERVAKADCLVCFSRLETFGVPIIEAWASGIPAIASTAAAVVDGFDARLGVEVSPDHPEELGAAMKQIYRHRDAYDPQFLADFARNKYSEDAVSKLLMDLYEGEQGK